MNKLPKYWVVKNDGSKKYFDIVLKYINKKYNRRWCGSFFFYYGFDGNAKYNGTNAYHDIESFINNPTLLTLDEFIELSKEVDEFVLPEKWIVKINSKEEGIVICKWAGSAWYNNSLNVNFVDYKKIGKTTNWENLPEITFEEFTKYVLKQDSMEKEIIGYKCPVDLFNGNIKKDWILFKDSDGNTYRPKGQGPLHALPKEIVETWEPVYKEEFKVGDWITVIGDVSGGWLAETKLRTFKITKEKTQYSTGMYFGVSVAFHKDCKLYTEARLATEEEIRHASVSDITINGYKAEFFDDYVKFGCAKISKYLIFDLYKCISKSYDDSKKIESVQIGKGTFSIDVLERICKFYTYEK